MKTVPVEVFITLSGISPFDEIRFILLKLIGKFNSVQWFSKVWYHLFVVVLDQDNKVILELRQGLTGQ